MNEELIKNAANQGIPALTELFKNLSKEDALKGIGIMAVMGIAYEAIKAVVAIVSAKK